MTNSILDEKDLTKLREYCIKLQDKLISLEDADDDWSDAVKHEGRKLLEKLSIMYTSLIRREAVVYLDEYLNGEGEKH